MESRMGRSSSRARASASSPHGYQSTGLPACWRRYGLVSAARRFTRPPYPRSGRPPRRPVELPLEPPAEHAFEPARDLDDRVDVDAGLDAVAMELPREVPGRAVPGPLRRDRAAAEPADRGVEDGRAALERGPRRGVAGVPRVVPVEADRPAEDRDPLDEVPH